MFRTFQAKVVGGMFLLGLFLLLSGCYTWKKVSRKEWQTRLQKANKIRLTRGKKKMVLHPERLEYPLFYARLEPSRPAPPPRSRHRPRPRPHSRAAHPSVLRPTPPPRPRLRPKPVRLSTPRRVSPRRHAPVLRQIPPRRPVSVPRRASPRREGPSPLSRPTQTIDLRQIQTLEIYVLDGQKTGIFVVQLVFATGFVTALAIGAILEIQKLSAP